MIFLAKIRSPRSQNTIQRRLHFLQCMGSAVAWPSGIQVKKRYFHLFVGKCCNHAFWIRSVARDDVAAKVPILIGVACVLGNGSNVDGAGLRSFRGQFYPEKWALERGSVSSELDATSASAVHYASRGELVFTHHLGAQRSYLPGGGQRPPLVGVMKEQTFGGRRILSQLDQTLCACINGT